MDGDPKGAYAMLALLLAWLGYRAGSSSQRMSGTWLDHKETRAKANKLSRTRWTHLGWAALGWAVLLLAVFIVVTL